MTEKSSMAIAALITLLVYLAIGGVMCIYGPLAKKRKAEVFGTSITLAISGRAAPGRLMAFRALILLGIVLVWPIFLVDHYLVRK